ncbi:MAG: alkaline phosphatase family protein, partial [Verrucomicrobiaceae bacterium]
MTRNLILSSLALLLFTEATLHGKGRADHVFIISFDGGKPAVIQESKMPVLKRLAAKGAVTWTAQTIFPSKTLPSHTSMLTGLGIEKHHVTWNDYTPIRGKVKVPTIFSLAKQTSPDLITAMFPGKVKFRHLWQQGSVDVFDY